MAVEDQRLPARLRAVAVGGEIHHRRFDHHRRQAVRREPLAATAVAGAQDIGDGGRPLRGLGGLDLAVEDEAPVACEQCADRVPQAELRILGIGSLQRGDRTDAFGAVEIAGEAIQRRIGLRWNREHQGEDRAEQGERTQHLSLLCGIHCRVARSGSRGLSSRPTIFGNDPRPRKRNRANFCAVMSRSHARRARWDKRQGFDKMRITSLESPYA